MRVFLDTNVLLDNFDGSRPNSGASRKVIRFCEQERNQGLISALSVANILYILRKLVRTCEERALVVWTLCDAYEVIPLERGDFLFATGEGFGDFEDGLQILAAEKMKADCIVTNDKKGFGEAKVKVLTPGEFVALIDTRGLEKTQEVRYN